MDSQVTKQKMVEEVARRLAMSESDVSLVYNELLEVIKESLKRRKTVVFRGFGKLYPLKLKKRSMRSPQTGKMLHLPARYTVRFKPSPFLKQDVNS